MTKSAGTTVDVGGVGPVVFAKSKRAKRLSITIGGRAPFVRVTVPWRVSMRAADEFFRTKIDWVRKHLANIEPAQPCPEVDYGRAKAMLVGRCRQLSIRHGLPFNRLCIRHQKTRWGSCSAKNNINLNIALASLDQPLIDYVICHELVHTKVKNHSRRFWRELSRLVPEARLLDKKLKKYCPANITLLGCAK